MGIRDTYDFRDVLRYIFHEFVNLQRPLLRSIALFCVFLDQLRHRLFKVLEEQPPNHVDMHNSLLDWGAVGHVDLERICAFDSDTVVLLDCCRAGSDESLYLSSLFAVIKTDRLMADSKVIIR